jgi:phosphomevalonate kinase
MSVFDADLSRLPLRASLLKTPMAGEHNTPIGTPILIAPGKIFLVGEYAVLDEGSAVVAAIGRYARAQFIPRAETMPPLVAEVVKRAREHLGDVTAALPSGAVLVDTNDFELSCPTGGLGSSAAIAVAAAASVYESLGLDLGEHKAEILAIADAGRRIAQGNVGSGADTVAAAYGGVIEVARSKGAAPILRNLAVPAGLHLVLFTAGPSISTKKMLAGLRAYAERKKGAFAHATAGLREISQRFVDELVAGSATGAVRAAGEYGDALAELALAAEVPIVSDDFAHAARFAREFGGIAKPAAAGGGQIGLAMFATPEAARLFRRACTAQLAALDGDLDVDGVRCQAPAGAGKTDEITLTTTTPSPDQQDLGDNSEQDFEQDFEEDAETTIQGFDLSMMAAVVPKKDTVSASPIEIPAITDTVAVPPGKQGRSSLRRAAVFSVAILATVALIGWLGAARHRDRSGAVMTFATQSPSATSPLPDAGRAIAATLEAAPESPDTDHAVATTFEAAPKNPDTESAPALEALAPPVPKPSTEPTTATARTTKRPVHSVHAARSDVASPGRKKRAQAAPSLRAGDLSPDDF